MNRINFELTNRCNLECKHCLREEVKQTKDLSVDFIERILTQAKRDYRIEQTSFTGGEPLLYPDLERLFEIVDELDLCFGFVTNGHLLDQRIELLKRPHVKRRLSFIAVSLDGPDAKTHDSIRGKGSFKKAMKAIMLLKSLNITTSIKFTVGRHNLDKLEEMILAGSHLEADKMEIAHMHPTPDNVSSGLIPDPAEFRAAESVINRMIKGMKMQITMTAGLYINPSFYTCAYLTMSDMYVDVDGRLCLCCQLPGARGRDADKPQLDIIADLNQVELFEAHKKLIDVIGELQRKRVERIANRDLDETDHFGCTACARYFGKMDWLDAFPENPWGRSPG